MFVLNSSLAPSFPNNDPPVTASLIDVEKETGSIEPAQVDDEDPPKDSEAAKRATKSDSSHESGRDRARRHFLPYRLRSNANKLS